MTPTEVATPLWAVSCLLLPPPPTTGATVPLRPRPPPPLKPSRLIPSPPSFFPRQVRQNAEMENQVRCYAMDVGGGAGVAKAISCAMLVVVCYDPIHLHKHLIEPSSPSPPLPARRPPPQMNSVERVLEYSSQEPEAAERCA